MLEIRRLALGLLLVGVFSSFCYGSEPILLGACGGGGSKSSDGGVCESHGALPYNSTVAFDIETASGYGSTRLHGSSLSIEVREWVSYGGCVMLLYVIVCCVLLYSY